MLGRPEGTVCFLTGPTFASGYFQIFEILINILLVKRKLLQVADKYILLELLRAIAKSSREVNTIYSGIYLGILGPSMLKRILGLALNEHAPFATWSLVCSCQ